MEQITVIVVLIVLVVFVWMLLFWKI